jgi:hypothetical protein
VNSFDFLVVILFLGVILCSHLKAMSSCHFNLLQNLIFKRDFFCDQHVQFNQGIGVGLHSSDSRSHQGVRQEVNVGSVIKSVRNQVVHVDVAIDVLFDSTFVDCGSLLNGNLVWRRGSLEIGWIPHEAL